MHESGNASPGSLEEDLLAENGKPEKTSNFARNQIAKELSDVVNYCQATKFRGLRSLPLVSNRQSNNQMKVSTSQSIPSQSTRI